jgi:hypothetical protein
MKKAIKLEPPDSNRLMLAYLCTAVEKESSLLKKVELLDRFGLSDAEISRVCGSAVQSIRNARQTAKKGRI